MGVRDEELFELEAAVLARLAARGEGDAAALLEKQKKLAS
jgi:hypothetical protein